MIPVRPIQRTLDRVFEMKKNGDARFDGKKINQIFDKIVFLFFDVGVLRELRLKMFVCCNSCTNSNSSSNNCISSISSSESP